VSDIAARLKDHERRKEERRVMQMRSARERARAAKAAKEAEAAGQNGDGMEVDEEEATATGEKRKHDDAPEEADKKPRVDDVAKAEAEAEAARAQRAEQNAEAVQSSAAEYAARYAEPPMPWSSMTLTKPSPEMRGHTSYLTFATFYPAAIRAKLAAQDSEPVTRLGTPSAPAPAAEDKPAAEETASA